jgi:hypothetical protein
MSRRKWVLHVEVTEMDEHGKMISQHCSHSEAYSMEALQLDKLSLEKLIQCAYEGFDIARNRFCELFGAEK